MSTEEKPVPSMDDKDTPSPPTRSNWQYAADCLLGINGPPWGTDEARLKVLPYFPDPQPKSAAPKVPKVKTPAQKKSPAKKPGAKKPPPKSKVRPKHYY